MIKPSTLTGKKRSIWPIDRPRENPTIGKVKNSRNNPRGSPPICKEGGFSMTKNQFSSSSVKMSSFATANPTDVRCGYILARPLWRRFTSSVDIMIIYDSVLDSSLLLSPRKNLLLWPSSKSPTISGMIATALIRPYSSAQPLYHPFRMQISRCMSLSVDVLSSGSALAICMQLYDQ